MWAAVVVAVLAAGIAVVAVNRAPIAEKLVRGQLAEMGLGGSNLEITRLTPWRVEVRNLATGPAGTARIARLGMDLTWPSWTAPKVGALSLEGVQLSLAIKGGTVNWGDLMPLFADGGTGGGALALPEITLTDTLIDIAHAGGPTTLSLMDVALAPQAGGGLVLKQALVDIVHPLAQATIRLTGHRAKGGQVALDIVVEGGQGSLGGGSVAHFSGPMSISGDLSNPLNMDATAAFSIEGLRGPMQLRGGGNVKAKMKGGVAHWELDLVESSRGLLVNAAGQASLAGKSTRKVTSVMAKIEAPDLETLGVVGLSGRATVKLDTDLVLVQPEPVWASIFSPLPVWVELDAADVRYPGFEGPWNIWAKAQVDYSKDDLVIRLNEDASVSGKPLGGQVEARLAGGLELGLIPLRLKKINAEKIRLKLDRADVAGASFDGPLALEVVPGGSGTITFTEGVATKLDMKYRMTSPSASARFGGRMAVLRTARVTGGVTVTVPPAGPPDVRLTLAGLDAHLPDLDIEAEGLSLTATGQGAANAAWNLQAAAKTLRHTAAAPFAVTAKGRWSPRKWDVEGTLRQDRSGLIASFAANETTRTKAGSGRVDMVPLNLAGIDGGVHAITPLLTPFIKSITGTVQASAITEWDKTGLRPIQVTGSLRGAGITPAPALLPPAAKGFVAGFSSLAAEFSLPPGDPAAGTGTFAVTGGNLQLGPTQATGISGRVQLEHLWPPVSPPGQEVVIEQVVAALPAADGRLRFQILGPSSIKVERAELAGIGGRIWAEDMAIRDGVPPERMTLHVDGVGLGDLAAQMNIPGLKAEGKLSGRIPVKLGEGGTVAIRGGLLTSQGKGLLAFKSPTRPMPGQAPEGGRIDMVLDILEDLRFDGMTLTLDGDAQKDVQIQAHVQGRNPKIQEGRPVDLTVNLTGNIGQAIQAELRNFDIRGLAGAK
ncbi:MAG TPA: hypothetical protein DIW51_06425 [Rhodospirillaceae bacterium]|nr:hypothetical protein [Magnetovibrio sp.]HCS69589.1 hypothetical protein [Rhodospirillaceae bacterium]